MLKKYQLDPISILWVHPNLVGNMAVSPYLWPDLGTQSQLPIAPPWAETSLAETVGGCPTGVLKGFEELFTINWTKIHNWPKKHRSVTDKTHNGREKNWPYGFPGMYVCVYIYIYRAYHHQRDRKPDRKPATVPRSWHPTVPSRFKGIKDFHLVGVENTLC